MKVVIDKNAGVCGGVSRALRFAEDALKNGKATVSIGPLIHNQVEIDRLSQLGLETVPQDIFEKSNGWIKKYADSNLLIRAHGIAPTLQKSFEKDGFSIIDGTCPKVRNSLEIIGKYAEDGYQIIIVGKAEHPEVKAMVGAAANSAIVVLKYDEAQKVEIAPKCLVIAQTTTNQQNFLKIVESFREQNSDIIVKNTICNAVSKRHEHLKSFAKQHDVIIFIGGKNSSNTKELFEICRAENYQSYLIEKFSEIDLQWLLEARSVGISGSASTPWWQLERIRSELAASLLDCTT